MEAIIIPKDQFDELKTEVMNITKMLTEKQKQQAISSLWLDIPETCNALRVSVRTLQSYRDKGILPFSQYDGKIYFKVADLEAHLNRHYVKSFKK